MDRSRPDRVAGPRSRHLESRAQGDVALTRAKRVGTGPQRGPGARAAGEVAEAVPALAERLADPGEDPTVRTAAAWALGRIGTDHASQGPAARPGKPTTRRGEAMRVGRRDEAVRSRE